MTSGGGTEPASLKLVKFTMMIHTAAPGSQVSPAAGALFQIPGPGPISKRPQ